MESLDAILARIETMNGGARLRHSVEPSNGYKLGSTESRPTWFKEEKNQRRFLPALIRDDFDVPPGSFRVRSRML